MEKENRELFNYFVSLGLILPIQNCTNDSCLKKDINVSKLIQYLAQWWIKTNIKKYGSFKTQNYDAKHLNYGAYMKHFVDRTFFYLMKYVSVVLVLNKDLELKTLCHAIKLVIVLDLNKLVLRSNRWYLSIT
ncbi:hypothetical protein BpHYR1_023413 [Brachionus plicatilis]|uniref:Uncharacterized protein n=1 Tax=Brachionus plicatilis TaxID=10195 RepID=A0A3M7QYY3_BRAPC|nr:hypothetical protein BpHYR1_023413 [Brachionus plicatilis]